MKQTKDLEVAKMWRAMGLVVEGQCRCVQTRKEWNTIDDLESSGAVEASLAHFHAWRIRAEAPSE